MDRLDIRQTAEDEFLVLGADIDLQKTFTCGQCFRWSKDGDGWTGAALDRVIHTRQAQDGLYIKNTSYEDVRDLWIDYFDLRRDYSQIAVPYMSDKFICACAEYGRGIRILRQDPVETIISFIISSNNNIKRISGIIDRFCELYGQKAEWGGRTFGLFPHAEELKSVTLEGLQPIRAGFRDKYIVSACDTLLSDPHFIDKVAAADTDEARRLLTSIKGVGPKVCDCILLFGFGRYEAFPKDVWINRVMQTVYGKTFNEKALGKYAGVLQQYMFYYARANSLKPFERTDEDGYTDKEAV